jgi:hypothetical protein
MSIVVDLSWDAAFHFFWLVDGCCISFLLASGFLRCVKCKFPFVISLYPWMFHLLELAQLLAK